jgi:hypothetical protein
MNYSLLELRNSSSSASSTSFLCLSSLCLVLNHSFTCEDYGSLIKVCFSYLFQGCFFFFSIGSFNFCFSLCSYIYNL